MRWKQKVAAAAGLSALLVAATACAGAGFAAQDKLVQGLSLGAVG